MKKKLALLMLSIAAVLCMIGFVACSNDTEDPPVTITDPTLQEQYDAFCEFIENDTDKYAVSLSMDQAGDKVTEMLSELSAGKAMILDRSEHYDFLDVTS